MTTNTSRPQRLLRDYKYSAIWMALWFIGSVAFCYFVK